jgi:hypothetical protein
MLFRGIRRRRIFLLMVALLAGAVIWVIPLWIMRIMDSNKVDHGIYHGWDDSRGIHHTRINY